MTNNQHGQVPEALIDLIDAYAETRHRCGRIHNAKTEAARNAVIEALSGVQALSAAPAVPTSVKGAMWFTKKPVTIQAIQWTGENLREVITFTDGPPDTRSHHAGMAWDAYRDLVARDGLKIYTLEGKMLASPGDWIIRGVKGELYPCKPDIFQETYAAASPTPPAEQQAQPGAVYAELHEPDATTVGLGAVWNRHSMRDFADRTHALRMQAAPKAAPAQAAVAGLGQETCQSCQGNGEIVTNWERYKHPSPGDSGDEAVAECQDCDGLGVVDAAPTTQAAPMESVLIDGVAYQTPAPVAAELLRLHIDARQAASQQEAQEPCPTCAALARTVMLDQVSFDRKPDCYGIRQITDDEGVEEWEDIRTSPDVAREEANDMMATGRGEIYEVVPLWTTPQLAPQPAPTAQGDALNNTVRVPLDSLHADAAYLIGRLQLDTMDGARVVEIIRERIEAAMAARSQAKEGANHE